MTPERWARVDQLLDAALERTPSERATFLHTACAGDDQLRGEVESLLAAHERAGSFINTVAAGEAARLVIDHSGVPERAARLLGQTLGRYEIVELLGAGGMGEVYRARDTRLDRQVAVKVLPPHLAAHPDALARFAREAKAVAALSHPNILAIHDFGAEAGLSYAVMELLEGETLRARLQRTKLTWREAAKIGGRVATGLAAAHARDIIHRDIKPENIFLTADGQTKILDFGIARVRRLAASTAETQVTENDPTTPGTLLGTIGYMSPEQVRGETAEAPSDIFSLGCVLAEMVTGRRLFAGSSAAETMAAILRDEPPALSTGAEEIPFEFERLVSRCLMKDPGERFQSAQDLALDLRALQTTNTFSGRTSAPPKPAPRSRAWLYGALALVLLLGVSVWFYFRARDDDAAGAPRNPALAVLPFATGFSDNQAEYLSAGISQAIINNLSQLPQLSVLAWSTVSNYEVSGPRALAAGRELKVKAIVTGSVAQRGEDLLIAVELINAENGAQMWGQQYQRPLTQVMDTQNEIARQISDKLHLTLTDAEQRRLVKRHTDNSEAYQLYLRGHFYVNQPNLEDVKRGLKYFEQAIGLDPNYALAYAGLSEAYYNFSNVFFPPKEMMPKAKAAAVKALELDAALAEAHLALANVLAFYEWDWDEAERAYRRALALNPGSAHAHQTYGLHLIALGRPTEAAAEITRAAELDPLTLDQESVTAWPFYFAPSNARQYDRALERLDRILKLHPEAAGVIGFRGLIYTEQGAYDEAIKQFAQAAQHSKYAGVLAGLGCAYARAGKTAEARRILTQLQQRAQAGEHLENLHFVFLCAALGDHDEAFAWLQKAYDQRDEDLRLLNVDPRFDPLRADPRFSKLQQEMRLAR